MIKTLVLALLCLGCRDREPVLQTAVAVSALDDGSAIVMWRESQVYWLGSFDSKLRLVWSSRLAGTPTIHTGGTYPLVVDTNSASVLTHQEVDAGYLVRVESFARLDGARSEARLGVSNQDGETASAAPFAMGELLHAYFDGSLVTLDPRNGVEHRRLPLAFTPDRVIARGSMAVLQGGLADAVVNASGEIRPLPGTRGCLIDGRVWKLVEDGNRHSFVAVDGQDGYMPLELLGARAVVEQCARHETKLIALLSITPFGEENRREVWIIERDGRTVGRIPLSLSARASAATEQPRFAPILDSKNRRQTITMLDLQHGQIAWLAEFDTTVVDAPILVGDNWYFFEHSSTPLLAVVSGVTGKLVAAKQLRGAFGVQPPTTSNVAANRIWLLRARERPSTDAMVAVLDLATFARHGGFPTDVSEAPPESPLMKIPRNE